MTERDAIFASATTLFSAYRPIERYGELLRQFHADRFKPAVSLNALDAFLLRQLITFHSTTVTIIDLAADATMGASVIGLADHPQVRRIIIPQTSQEQNGLLNWRVLLSRAAEELGLDASSTTFTDGLGDESEGWASLQGKIPPLSPVVVLVAAHPDDSAALTQQLSLIFEQRHDALVVLMPLGQIGRSATLATAVAFTSEASAPQLTALREIVPFFASSQLALLYRRHDPSPTKIVERLHAQYEGNFQFLSLVEAVTAGAMREETELVNAREEIARTRARLGELERLIPLKDQHIANLENTIRQLSSDAHTSSSQIAIEKDRQIATLESELAGSRKNTEYLANQLVHSKNQLHNIQSRASWRLLERAWKAQITIAPPASPQGKAWLAATRVARKGLRLGQVGATSSKAQARESADSSEDDRASLPEMTGDERDPYAIWRVSFEPDGKELIQQRQRAQQLPARPLISVITPVFDPPPQILRETIISVTEQTYDNWELCLVDGGSTNPEIRTVLTESAAADARIRVAYLDRNYGIVGNTNEAAYLAEGEFLAFLDHDDRLAPNALFAVAEAINDGWEVDLIYFDEDKISADGRDRSEPFFKPDWSPEMLLSANYLMHSVVRRDLFEAAGGLVEGMEGAQDWDLMFRCAEHTTNIVHIPQILYHWRRMEGSTAATFEAKPYVFASQLRAVTEHLSRSGIDGASAHFARPGSLHVSWPVQQERVSIIIPTKDNLTLVRPCLNSILQLTDYSDFEIIIVDNDSQDPAVIAFYDELKRDPRITIVDFREPFNYSAANNLGAAHASGMYLLFLNNDIEVLEPEWLEELVRWGSRPEIGIVGAKLLYPDGRIQHAGVVMGLEGHASHIFWGVSEQYSGIFGSTEWYRNYLAVTGACMLMRASLFEEIGRFDETYQLVFSDIELCLRAAAAGYRNLYTPFARLRHHEGGSRGQHIPFADIVRGYTHMRDIVERGDPFYNANLSHAHRVPQFRTRDEISRINRLDALSRMQ